MIRSLSEEITIIGPRYSYLIICVISRDQLPCFVSDLPLTCLIGDRRTAHRDPMVPDIFVPVAAVVTVLACVAVSQASMPVRRILCLPMRQVFDEGFGGDEACTGCRLRAHGWKALRYVDTHTTRLAHAINPPRTHGKVLGNRHGTP
jgi:hypothetical protein